MNKRKDLNIAMVEDSVRQPQPLTEDLQKLAELHTEMAELKEEQQSFLVYKEFCAMKQDLRGLADVYEETGDMLRAEAIRRSVPLPPEFLDFMKRQHDEQFFEEEILQKVNIYEALLVYGPKWLEYEHSSK